MALQGKGRVPGLPGRGTRNPPTCRLRARLAAMTYRDQLNLTADGDVSGRVDRGSSLHAAWLLTRDAVQVMLTTPIGAIATTTGTAVLDLAPHLINPAGTVGLDIPSSVTRTLVPGLYQWTVQASAGTETFTLASGPFRVEPSATFPYVAA